ncbi:MAG: tRNA (adenosine(37)-N6)-threonylcarbamoyltransferase complex transferase subunit TsaD [Thermoanaerobaculia bacterium]|nr:tRNA (adenosine(37)-N6)-threonylcarbamoyltransferase complex transferase subunit TsaD [Thermoanaerobaculia bacterium]
MPPTKAPRRTTPPLILGIETSCDDTACAVLDGEGRVLSSVVASQLASHRPYGGVVPEIASREHLSNWSRVCAEALEPLGLSLADVDLVAATRGPGLVGSLLVGLATGKAIAWSLGKPFFGVHHILGHIFSPFLDAEGGPSVPIPEHFVALVVSGGHTSLFDIEGGRPTVLAETRDDAIGEVFDKVGKRLGLPYPQGPIVDRLAEDFTSSGMGSGRDSGVEREVGSTVEKGLPVPRVGDGNPYFSYSGLKSAAIRKLEVLERSGLVWDPAEPAPEFLALLADFRRAAVAQIVDRLERRHRLHPIATLAVSGGVAANRLLRRRLTSWADERGVDLRLVPLRFCGDNAAMIAHLAGLRHRRDPEGDSWSTEASGRLPISAP